MSRQNKIRKKKIVARKFSDERQARRKEEARKKQEAIELQKRIEANKALKESLDKRNGIEHVTQII